MASLFPFPDALMVRVILDEAAEVGHDVGDDDEGTGDVALMSPSKMETLGKLGFILYRKALSCFHDEGVGGRGPHEPRQDGDPR